MDIAATFGAGQTRRHRFSIYIPSKDKAGTPVDQERWVQQCLRTLCGLFGGATALPPLRDAWINPESDELVVEQPVIVYSFVELDAFEANAQFLAGLVKDIGRQANQEQMAFEFDGAMHFVDI